VGGELACELLDKDHLEFADKEAEYGADGDHEHLVVFEDRSKYGFVLRWAQFVHLVDDEILDVERLSRVVLRFGSIGRQTRPLR
jgi:hypothetical protein